MWLKHILPCLIFLSFIPLLQADEDWTYVNREEKVGNFQLNQKGKLSYQGEAINGFSLQSKADRVAISPASPNGAYSVLFSFGDESHCFLLSLQKHEATQLSFEGEPLVWNSWSPDSNFLVLGSYSDSGTNLNLITLNDGQNKKVPISLVKQSEMQELDTGTLIWTSPEMFDLTATIHCSGCDSAQQEQIIRSYKIHVQTTNLDVKSEEVQEQPVQ